MQTQDEKTMTLQEAREAGYFLCGESGDEMYTLLSDFEDEKELALFFEERDGPVYLAEQECSTEGFPCADSIIDDVISGMEIIEDGYEDVEEILKQHKQEIQDLFDKIEAKIKEEKATHTYELTNIKLVLSNDKEAV